MFIIIVATLSLPFLTRTPIDLPPIVSIELIQITDKTSIPFAPKAKKIIEKIKKEENERVVSEQAPPKKVKKEKPDTVPLPDEKIEKVKKIEEKKQNPEKIETEVKQVSEFEKRNYLIQIILLHWLINLKKILPKQQKKQIKLHNLKIEI